MPKIVKLPSGNYNAQLYDYTDDTGKRHYKSITHYDKKQLQVLVAEFKRDKKRKSIPDKLTLREAMQKYIDSRRSVLSPSTIAGYEKIMRNNVKALQNMQLDKLTNTCIQRSLNDDSSKYAAKTVKNIYGFITSVLTYIMPELQLHLTYPQNKKDTRDLPPPEVIIGCVKGTSVELPVLLAMWLSLRMSEVRGLRFDDITDDGYIWIRHALLDVDNKFVVRDNTKTYGSTRKLKIPAYIKGLMIDNGSGYIVPETANTITKRFYRLLDKNNIAHVRFHDLRHMNASIMLALGVPDKYAMERGGWITDNVLRSVYQHTFTDKRKVIDDEIDNYFDTIIDKMKT